MPAFTIPVAFCVTDVDTEQEAAALLVDRVVAAQIIGGGIESWWTPNHRDADGSDNDARIAWFDEPAAALVANAIRYAASADVAGGIDVICLDDDERIRLVAIADHLTALTQGARP